MCVRLFSDAEAIALGLFDAVNSFGEHTQVLLQLPCMLVQGSQLGSKFVELPIECGYLLITCP